MNIYEVKLMIQKEGKKPARLGFYEVEATSEQVALGIATAAGKKHYNNALAITGLPRDEKIRIWAELV